MVAPEHIQKILRALPWRKSLLTARAAAPRRSAAGSQVRSVAHQQVDTREAIARTKEGASSSGVCSARASVECAEGAAGAA